jgi:hypothetical protein
VGGDAAAEVSKLARIRTIKPEFQQSASMGRVSRDARLTFIELWPQCDDYGTFRAEPKMLASVLFPYDRDAPDLIAGWLNELEHEGCITRYAVDGKAYLQVVKFLEHQKIERPSKPKYPNVQLADGSPTTQRTFVAPSPSTTPPEGKGREKEGKGKGKGCVRTASPRVRTRWPPDAVVADDWKYQAAEKRAQRGLPAIDIDTEADRFVNWAVNAPDRVGLKVDWYRAWENWVLSERQDGQARQHGKPSQIEQLRGIVEREQQAAARGTVHKD